MSNRLNFAAFALWYFLSGMAVLFVFLVLFDVNPHGLVFPGSDSAVQGPMCNSPGTPMGCRLPR